VGGGYAHENTVRRPARLAGQPARAGRGALRRGRARPDARARRAVPRCAPVAGPDGRHLSARRGRGGALDARPSRPARRRGGDEGDGRALGPERPVAGCFSPPAPTHGRAARLDAASWRGLPRAGTGGDGGRAAAAPARSGRRAPDAGRAPARGVGRRGHRHRARRCARGLRALLRSLGGLRRLGLARASAGRLGGLARLHRGAPGVLVGRGHRRHGRVLLRRLRLAPPPREGGACAKPLPAPARAHVPSDPDRQVAACAGAPSVPRAPTRTAAARRAPAGRASRARGNAPGTRAPRAAGAPDAAGPGRVAAAAAHRSATRATAARRCTPGAGPAYAGTQPAATPDRSATRATAARRRTPGAGPAYAGTQPAATPDRSAAHAAATRQCATPGRAEPRHAL